MTYTIVITLKVTEVPVPDEDRPIWRTEFAIDIPDDWDPEALVNYKLIKAGLEQIKQAFGIETGPLAH